MAKISTNVPHELKNAKRISQFQAAKTIVKSRGVLGLYTGFNLHLAREVAGSAIYFGVYETVKQSINSAYGMQHVNAPGAVAAAGMICGVVSGTAVCCVQSSTHVTVLTSKADIHSRCDEDSSTEPPGRCWCERLCVCCYISSRAIEGIKVERSRDDDREERCPKHDPNESFRTV